MTELLVKASETKFPERYIYKKRDWTEKEYESGLNLSYNVYNKNIIYVEKRKREERFL